MDVLNEELIQFWKVLNDHNVRYITVGGFATRLENDAHVYLGLIKKEEENFVFVNEEKGWRISFDIIKLKALKHVTPELKEMFLNADFVISVSIGGLPDQASLDFDPTGMKWH